MLHRTLSAAVVLAAVVLPISRAAAQDHGYPAVPLLSTGTTIVGEPLRPSA